MIHSQLRAVSKLSILVLAACFLLPWPQLLSAEKDLPDHLITSPVEPDPRWFRNQFGPSSRPVSSLEPLVVDSHVRCRRKLHPNRPVREQFRLHKLGLG